MYEDGLAIFKCRATDKMNPLNVRARAWCRQEWRQFRWDERVVEPSVEPEEEYLISSVAFVVYFFYPARVIILIFVKIHMQFLCMHVCTIIYCQFSNHTKSQ